MRTKEELKKALCDAIDARRDEIYAFYDSVYAEPELGFKEVKTAEKFAKLLNSLGYEPRTGVALTGVIADKKGKKSNARVAIMGEMDAIMVQTHPDADPLTGAVHACGHAVQLAAVAALAYAFADTDICGELDGDVVLMGVPAEEYVEITYRKKLRDDGKLWFLSGKQELIRLGEFDDIDCAIMQHTNAEKNMKAGVVSSCNGFAGKLIKYTGKEAHAGAAPFEGVNALNAAMMGLMAIHANRETFRDEDHIRVHPIITKGGDIVNVVPADVRIETYVRGSNTNAILNAAKSVDRALMSGAMAVGAECEITDLPGYLPSVPCKGLNDLMYENLLALYGTEEGVEYTTNGFGGGSTDAGDVSTILPTLHAFFAGARGSLHGEDYALVDRENAILNAAKALGMLAIDLLTDEAHAARQIKDTFVPVMTKEQYLSDWGKLS